MRRFSPTRTLRRARDGAWPGLDFYGLTLREIRERIRGGDKGPEVENGDAEGREPQENGAK